MPANAFLNASFIESVTLPSTVTSIGDNAFKGCTALQTASLSDKLEAIGKNAFQNCSALGVTYVPESVTSIGDNAFSGCTAVKVLCKSNSAAHYHGDANGISFALIDDHEHQYSLESQVEPTCTKPGYRRYQCSVCEFYHTETDEALGHDFEEEWTVDKEPSCQTSGQSSRQCTRCTTRTDVTTIPATGHSFTDWLVTVKPTALREGVKSRTCTVCGKTETGTVPRLYVDPSDPNYGLVYFTVVNAQSLDPIEGACLLVSTENEGDCVYTTDEEGKAACVLPTGKTFVSAYASNCLTRNLTITVKSGNNTVPPIGLSDKPTWDAQVTTHLMTYDEILAAGIDVNDAENKHLFKYDLTLSFTPGIDWLSLAYYWNGDDGLSIWGWGGGGSVTEVYGPDGPVSPGETSRLHGYPVFLNDVDDEDFPYKTHIHILGLGGEEDTEVYIVSEKFLLIIHGEVRWLKEMFDVEMVVVNNSMTDTLENVAATLDFPEGLGLAAMVGEPQTRTQELGTIEGGGSRSVHWYLRGDSAGSYQISARLTGVSMPFEEVIDQVYEAPNALQVYAGSAFHLDFTFPEACYKGDDYPIEVRLTNVSDRPIYNVSHAISVEQKMIFYKNDGTQEPVGGPGGGDAGGASVLCPGESIVFKTSVNIIFESRMLKEKLEKLEKEAGNLKKLAGLFSAYEAGCNAMSGVGKALKSCWGALGGVTSASFDGIEKAKATASKKLFDSITGLYSSYYSTGNDQVDKALELAQLGISDTLDIIARDPIDWVDKSSPEMITSLYKKVNSFYNSCTSEGSSGANSSFSAIRTLIDSIPIRFSLTGIMFDVSDDSTTRIPYSIHTTDVGVYYFGVSNVTQFAFDAISTIMGERINDDVCGQFGLIPPFDDVIDTKRQEKSLKAQIDELQSFRAYDSENNRTCTVKVLKSGMSLSSSDDYDWTKDFDITCEGADYTVNDGVLTFTGDAMINVIPKTMAGGTLVIEDSEGSRYEYDLTVVEKHDCSGGEWHTVLNPTDEYDGVAFKYCDVCGEIIDIKTLKEEDCCSEHSFGAWEGELEPSAASDGMRSHTCTLCGLTEYDFPEYEGTVTVGKGEFILTPKSVSFSAEATFDHSETAASLLICSYDANGHQLDAAVSEATLTEGTNSLEALLPVTKEELKTVKVFILSESNVPLSRPVTYTVTK